MKGLIFITIFLFATISLNAQGRYPIIPYPNKLIEGDGEFEFKKTLTVEFPRVFKPEMETLSSIFEKEYFTRLVPTMNGSLVVRQNALLEKEAYKLSVTTNGILIEASTGTGCFYAFQTIRHLMRLTGNGSYLIASCQIEDQPTFSWRSYMLDEGRHFQGMEVVKKLLDQMALMKMNIFHWHLTEDQGWRIEIKKYPLLTEVGAWRDSTIVRVRQPVKSDYCDQFAHGGYYTQREIKEIVSYALKRHITIVPEIEMPGHATAAIAAYPWLISNGEKMKVQYSIGIKNTSYNVADPYVYEFLEDVLREVMQLFPGNVIHIGGDEVKYDYWKNSSAVKLLMEKEELKNYADVQIFFTNRISNFIEKNGKRMMGWNEILGNVHVGNNEESGTTKLAQNSIIQFWKGDPAKLNEAIEKGYDVVNSNSKFTYLDFLYSSISLEKAYGFSPIPNDISPEKAKHILGLGCQMWGEVTPSVLEVYYFTFPRIAAYAEVGWTAEANKNFERFNTSLIKLKKYWDGKGILYYPVSKNIVN